MNILPASDSSVIVLFGEKASPAAHRRVSNLFHRLRALNDQRILNIHPAYASVLVDFDPLQIRHDEMIALLEQLIEPNPGKDLGTARQIEIPVCYGEPFGPDLDDVAAHCKISAEEVIRMHSSAVYAVSFLGFLPGFGYLAGLPAQLAVPRLATPRKLVHAGSVGIAGARTGIYPVDSPGGWRIIGRTPLRMFDPEAEPPALLRYGDHVRFIQIDCREFESQPAKEGEK
jgi:inhibitor of KinA